MYAPAHMYQESWVMLVGSHLFLATYSKVDIQMQCKNTILSWSVKLEPH